MAVRTKQLPHKRQLHLPLFANWLVHACGSSQLTLRIWEQVQVVDFKERPTAKDYIQIVISVESESQKPILLGRKGSALKQLATAARIDIEDFLGAGSLEKV